MSVVARATKYSGKGFSSSILIVLECQEMVPSSGMPRKNGPS